MKCYFLHYMNEYLQSADSNGRDAVRADGSIDYSGPLRTTCVYVDGVYLKRSWGGEIQNVSVLVAIGVNQEGYREILGAAEGMKEDHESWKNFFLWLKERGLTGVRLFVGDKNLGMLETIGEVFWIFRCAESACPVFWKSPVRV